LIVFFSPTSASAVLLVTPLHFGEINQSMGGRGLGNVSVSATSQNTKLEKQTIILLLSNFKAIESLSSWLRIWSICSPTRL
jgi:hypothetical protein